MIMQRWAMPVVIVVSLLVIGLNLWKLWHWHDHTLWEHALNAVVIPVLIMNIRSMVDLMRWFARADREDRERWGRRQK